LHARDWDIDGGPLGLCGVSAGGHLAALAALQPQAAREKVRVPWEAYGTQVDAVGLFFPPSDLVDYGGQPFDFARGGDFAVPRMLFPDGITHRSPSEILEAARAISPRHQVRGHHPPFWIAHATEDEIVPYSQSQAFAESLQSAGVDTTLVTHQGPGHPWPSVATDCGDLAAWFQAKLNG
jgi:acetyl esterase/lipase